MHSFIVFCAQYLIFIVGVVGVIAWLLQPNGSKKRLLLLFVLSAIIGLALAKVVGHFYYHPRPFVVDGIAPLIYHDASTGFPSEHTLAAFLIAFSILPFSRKWGVVLVALAAFVAWGRVAAHVHSWLDIMGGVAFALFSVVVVWYCLKKAPTKAILQ